MSNVWNNSLSIVGSVDPDGKVWNNSLSIVGSVDAPTSRVQAGGAALLLLLS